MTQTSSMVQADFTARRPVPQSVDKNFLFKFAKPIAESDQLEIHFREAFEKEPVGALTTNGGHFTINVQEREVTLHIKEEDTRTWFSKDKIKPAERIRTLTGTLLHRDANGDDYPWSGRIELKFRFELSFTRG